MSDASQQSGAAEAGALPGASGSDENRSVPDEGLMKFREAQARGWLEGQSFLFTNEPGKSSVPEMQPIPAVTEYDESEEPPHDVADIAVEHRPKKQIRSRFEFSNREPDEVPGCAFASRVPQEITEMDDDDDEEKKDPSDEEDEQDVVARVLPVPPVPAETHRWNNRKEPVGKIRAEREREDAELLFMYRLMDDGLDAVVVGDSQLSRFTVDAEHKNVIKICNPGATTMELADLFIDAMRPLVNQNIHPNVIIWISGTNDIHKRGGKTDLHLYESLAERLTKARLFRNEDNVKCLFILPPPSLTPDRSPNVSINRIVDEILANLKQSGESRNHYLNNVHWYIPDSYVDPLLNRYELDGKHWNQAGVTAICEALDAQSTLPFGHILQPSPLGKQKCLQPKEVVPHTTRLAHYIEFSKQHQGIFDSIKKGEGLDQEEVKNILSRGTAQQEQEVPEKVPPGTSQKKPSKNQLEIKKNKDYEKHLFEITGSDKLNDITRPAIENYANYQLRMSKSERMHPEELAEYMIDPRGNVDHHLLNFYAQRYLINIITLNTRNGLYYAIRPTDESYDGGYAPESNQKRWIYDIHYGGGGSGSPDPVHRQYHHAEGTFSLAGYNGNLDYRHLTPAELEEIKSRGIFTIAQMAWTRKESEQLWASCLEQAEKACFTDPRKLYRQRQRNFPGCKIVNSDLPEGDLPYQDSFQPEIQFKAEPDQAQLYRHGDWHDFLGLLEQRYGLRRRNMRFYRYGDVALIKGMSDNTRPPYETFAAYFMDSVNVCHANSSQYGEDPKWFDMADSPPHTAVWMRSFPYGYERGVPPVEILNDAQVPWYIAKCFPRGKCRGRRVFFQPLTWEHHGKATRALTGPCPLNPPLWLLADTFFVFCGLSRIPTVVIFPQWMVDSAKNEEYFPKRVTQVDKVQVIGWHPDEVLILDKNYRKFMDESRDVSAADSHYQYAFLAANTVSYNPAITRVLRLLKDNCIKAPNNHGEMVWRAGYLDFNDRETVLTLAMGHVALGKSYLNPKPQAIVIGEETRLMQYRRLIANAHTIASDFVELDMNMLQSPKGIVGMVGSGKTRTVLEDVIYEVGTSLIDNKKEPVRAVISTSTRKNKRHIIQSMAKVHLDLFKKGPSNEFRKMCITTTLDSIIHNGKKPVPLGAASRADRRLQEEREAAGVEVEIKSGAHVPVQAHALRWDIMAVDEAPTEHMGCIYTAIHRIGPQRLILSGDQKQLQFIPRPAGFKLEHHGLPQLTQVKFKDTFWRGGRDVVEVIKKVYEYPVFFADNGKPRHGINIHVKYRAKQAEIMRELLTLVDDVPLEKSVLILTFTKNDKFLVLTHADSDCFQPEQVGHRHESRLKNVYTLDEFRKKCENACRDANTIGASQGTEADVVFLIRSLPDYNQLYVDPRQCLVAGTRHREEFHYITPTLTDKFAEAMLDETGEGFANLVRLHANVDTTVGKPKPEISLRKEDKKRWALSEECFFERAYRGDFRKDNSVHPRRYNSTTKAMY